MPFYRDTPQVNISASINDARVLLEMHSSGPALRAHLARLDEVALAAIDDAQTNGALAKAIHDSRVSESFIHLAKLLRFHAEADTDGKGFEIYKNLAQWGVFNGARPLNQNALDAEINAYIASQPDDIRNTAKFNAAAVSTRIETLTAFKTFVIEISGLREGSIPLSDNRLQIMCEQIESLYGDDDEFKHAMIGAVSSDDDARCGVVFIATAPMALRIAQAHESLEIYTDRGARLPPPSARKQALDMLGMPYDI